MPRSAREPSMPLLLLLLLIAWPVDADTINVAVAANFRNTFEVLREDFRAASGVTVNASYGATGMLYTQIRSGAPFAAFYAADEASPRQLEADGLAVPQSRCVYARGSLVLWVPGATRPGAQWLTTGAQRVAIANPEIAPYGRAAMEVLQRLDFLPAGRDRIVLGNSIAQTLHFVVTRAVAGGLVARAQTLQLGVPATEIWQIPDPMYAPIDQAAVALAGRDSAAAVALLTFTQAPAARQLIAAHGYDLPP
jgi:molybdate transport system substrate-binding protein